MFEKTFLFLFVLFVIDTEESEVISSKTIEITIGEDAILLCNLTRQYDKPSLRVEWTCNGKDVHLYRKGEDDLNDQDKSFEDRTSLFHEEMDQGNISLKLTNVSAQDSGIYTCNVRANNLPEQVKECSIVLRAVLNQRMGHGNKPVGINTGAIVATVFIAIVSIGVGLFVTKRMIEKCAGRRGGQQNIKNDDVRSNLNNMRNNDNAD